MFNVKGTTTRGKLLKTLFTDPGIQHSDQSCNINQYDCCVKCGNNAPSSQSSVKCEICDVKFHTACLTHPLPDNFVTYQSTNPCLWWFCLDCTGNAEKELGNNPAAKGDSDSSSTQLQDFKQVVAEQLAGLKLNLMDDVNQAIETKLNLALCGVENNQSAQCFDMSSGSETSLTSRPSFASITTTNLSQAAFSPIQQVTKKPKAAEESPAEVLILTPIDTTQDISATEIERVKQSVGGKLKNLQVEFVRSNPQKKTIAVGFRDQKLRDDGNDVICADNHLSAMGFQSKLANKMLPKLTISGVPLSVLDGIDTSDNQERMRELEKQKILEKITDKNPGVAHLVELGHTLSVVFVGRVKRFEKETLTIGLKVSPTIRSTIFQQQRGMVYLDYSRYWASDRYYVKQCYHCQLLGHTSGDCPVAQASQPSVCMYCLESHRSKVCPNKQKTELHKCARCKSSTLTSDNNGHTNHHAGSAACPMIVRETSRLANMTDVTSKNVM